MTAPFPHLPALPCAALIVAMAWAGLAQAADFKVGDRLPPASAAAGHAPAKPAATAATAKAADFRLVDWDALMPKDWDPMKDLKTMDLGLLQDSDPRAQAALDKLKQAWDTAPVEPALDQQRVRIAGFVVPLDGTPQQMREFLLVPYFGACIHVPPPPANQVIHVIAKTPFKGVGSMSAMWVGGTLHTVISDTTMGTSGYKMDAEYAAPYEEPKKQ